jgi:hypothetical protein
MPVSYSIDPAQGLVTNVGTGVLTDADMRETQQRMIADADFRSTYSQLFDLTDVTEVRLTSSYLREMADATAFAPSSRRALVVTQTLLYGLSRMFQAFLGDQGEAFRVFRSRAEAESWLDLRRPGSAPSC